MNWLYKIARPQHGFLGNASVAFRTVDLSRAESVLNTGFQNNQFFATSEDRAVFYANFTSEPCPGAIFECLIDASRSHADMNDSTPEQQQEAYQNIQSAASEVYEYLRNAGIENIEVYEIEQLIGSQAASDIGGYYDGPESSSLWLFVSERTGMSPSEIPNIVSPGTYGGFFTLDNRGVFGIGTDISSEQLQHSAVVPPENIQAVYLHTSLLSNLGWNWETSPNGNIADGMNDYVSVIPAQMEELDEAIREQLSVAAQDSGLSGYLYDLLQDFEENMSGYEDQHGSTMMPGIVYRKLRSNDPLTEEDFSVQHGFVRFELPANRMRVLYAIRKGCV